jgi:hypothetical protein
VISGVGAALVSRLLSNMRETVSVTRTRAEGGKKSIEAERYQICEGRAEFVDVIYLVI